MPACGIEAVVIWHIVPVIEITPGSAAIPIFMIANSRVGDPIEFTKESIGGAIPVMKFRVRAILIDIPQIQEHVGVPGIDQSCHLVPRCHPAGTIARHSQREGLARRRCCPWPGCERIVVDRRLRNTIEEC